MKVYIFDLFLNIYIFSRKNVGLVLTLTDREGKLDSTEINI